MRYLLGTTTLAISAFLLAAPSAHADCSPFNTPGSGATLSGDARCIIFNPGDGEQLRAGDQPGGSVGAVSITNGAVVNLDSGNPANAPEDDPFVAIGRRPGATGTMTISGPGSALNVNGNDNGAAVHIGREGAGNVTVENNGQMNIRDLAASPGTFQTGGESLSVGMNGGVGTLTADNGSVTVNSTSGAFIFVGREGGNGTFNVQNGANVFAVDQNTTGDGGGANITIGRDVNGVFGATGEMNVTGGTVSVQSTQNFGGIFVGRESGTNGTLNVSGAGTLMRAVSGTEAGIQIGRDGGSSGTVTVTDGAILRANSDDSFMTLGREAGATGALNVTNGGQVSVTGSTDGDISVGAAFADFGRTDGGSGTLTVTGAGSTVTVTDRVIVGAPEQFGGGNSLGRLTIADGGQVIAGNEVLIGTGGILDGNGGSILGDLVLDGGTIAPGASPGVLDVTGDFTILGGLLDIEIGGIIPGSAFDVINVSGDLIADNPFDIRLSFIDGFAPGAGDTFDFLNIAGDSSDLSTLLAASLLDVDVVGLPSGFAFDLGFDATTGTLSAITSVSAVPLPASFGFLLAGLAGLGLIGRRRRLVA